MGKYYVARYKVDYADEFDVSGMKAYTEEGLNVLHEQQKKVLKMEEDGTLYIDLYEEGIDFGTNEALLFNDVDEVISAIKITEITEDEYNTLVRLGFSSFGEEALFDFFKEVSEDQ